MRRREKIIAIAAGAVVVLFVLHTATKKFLLEPAGELDLKAMELTGKIDALERETSSRASYASRIAKFLAATYGEDELDVSERLKNRLTGLVERSGLSREHLTLTPVTGRGWGVYREIGWSVRARGSLEEAVDFVYLLRAEPRLHRVESLGLSVVSGGRDIDVRVKYVTLALNRGKLRISAGPSPATQPTAGLDDPARALYSVITDRNLFRPRARRVVARPVGTKPPPIVEAPTPPPPAGGSYRLVGLPNWAGQPEIIVRDTGSGAVKTYTPGDTLGDWKIVMVDYRPMPTPAKPELISVSRAIFRIAREYWAVELGHNLAQKHRMEKAKLPEELRKALDASTNEPPSDDQTEG